MLIWRVGQDTQDHCHLCDPPHAWLSPGPLVTFPRVSPHWSLLPWWRPDQIRTKCCDRVSRECWVTTGTRRGNTGSGGGPCLDDAKTNTRTLFILCFNNLLFSTTLKWERENVIFSKWFLCCVSRRRYFLYTVCADCGLMTLNCDLRVRRCCVVDSQVQRPEPGSTTCGGVEQQQRHGVRVLG